MNRVHSHYALLMMSEMSPVAAVFFRDYSLLWCHIVSLTVSSCTLNGGEKCSNNALHAKRLRIVN